MAHRRRFLRGTVAAASVGVAGCFGLGGSDGSGNGRTPVETTFVDDCSSTTYLDDAADAGNLGPDTTNVENFEHPDGSTDEARLNRTGSTDDAALVYAPRGDLQSARAEFHWHEDAGGDVRVEASGDAGDSWHETDTARSQYGGVDNGWLHTELSTSFGEDTDAVRYVLTGGAEVWSGQLGHVEIDLLTTDPDVPTPTPTPGATPTPTPVPLGTPVEGSADDVAFDEFVDVDGTDFVVGDDPVTVAGGNHPQVSRLDGGITAADWLDTWTELTPALNVLRVPAFGEGQVNYLQPEPGEFNERAFELLDRVIYRFGSAGVRLVLPLANCWDWRGGIPQYVEWSDTAETRDDFYADEQCQEWYRASIERVLTRENHVTGVEYRDDPTIMLWELANEPRAGGAGYDAYRQWTRDTAEYVKSIDENHLVSTGMEGFYGPDGPAGDDDSRYVETHSIDALDACSFHLYPDAWGMSYDEGTEWIRDHTRDANEEVGKPSYLGEFGVEVDRLGDSVHEALATRNEVYTQWFDALVEEGTDGAMVWDLRTAAEYEWTHSWNLHAVYPRDEETVSLLDGFTQDLTSPGDTGSGN